MRAARFDHRTDVARCIEDHVPSQLGDLTEASLRGQQGPQQRGGRPCTCVDLRTHGDHVGIVAVNAERLRLFDRVPAFAFCQQTSIRCIDPKCEIGTIKALWCALKQNGPKQYNAFGAV